LEEVRPLIDMNKVMAVPEEEVGRQEEGQVAYRNSMVMDCGALLVHELSIVGVPESNKVRCRACRRKELGRLRAR
jgi:hypothetical protein